MIHDLEFIKMNAAGNDFIIFDHRNYQGDELNETQIQNLSNRNNIGCDQLIVLKIDQRSDCLMEIYNSDGSASGACGNATRCVAGILFNEDNSKNIIKIRVQEQILICHRQENDEISVNMGIPKFEAKDIPMSEDLNPNGFSLLGHTFYALNIGNPHIVTFMEQRIYDKIFHNLGPTLESNEIFPEKANVEFAEIIHDNLINARVYERGAGETLSCGSGACAIGAIAIRNKLISTHSTTIRFKGGDIKIKVDDDGSIIMTGGYNTIFSGKINANFFN